MGEVKLTKAERKTLEWFAVVEHASMFGRGDPSLSMVRRLEKAGLLARVGSDPGRFGFTRYALNAAGRSALKSNETPHV